MHHICSIKHCSSHTACTRSLYLPQWKHMYSPPANDRSKSHCKHKHFLIYTVVHFQVHFKLPIKEWWEIEPPHSLSLWGSFDWHQCLMELPWRRLHLLLLLLPLSQVSHYLYSLIYNCYQCNAYKRRRSCHWVGGVCRTGVRAGHEGKLTLILVSVQALQGADHLTSLGCIHAADLETAQVVTHVPDLKQNEKKLVAVRWEMYCNTLLRKGNTAQIWALTLRTKMTRLEKSLPSFLCCEMSISQVWDQLHWI